MADTITAKTVNESGSLLTVKVHCVSDGVGVTDGILVDKSAFALNGVEPSSLTVLAMRWAVQGYSNIVVEWDRGTDVVIGRLSGNGYDDWRGEGGLVDTGSGGTGDIVVTPVGPASGATFDLTLWLKKE